VIFTSSSSMLTVSLGEFKVSELVTSKLGKSKDCGGEAAGRDNGRIAGGEDIPIGLLVFVN